MPDIKVAVGEMVNLVARGQGHSISAFHTAADGAPLSQLYDGRPGTPHRIASIAPVWPITWWVNLNGITNGDGELAFVGSFPAAAPTVYGRAGWGKSEGAVFTRETTLGVVDSGSASVSVFGSAGSYGFFDWPTRSGERFNWSIRLRGDAAGKTANLCIQNMDTGKWWNGSAWVSVDFTLAGQVTGTTYTTRSGTATVESYTLCQRDRVLLRFYILGDLVGGDKGYFDEFRVWPSVNGSAFFGHDIPARGVVEIVSGTNPAAAPTTVRGTVSARQAGFYTLFTENAADHVWGFRLSGLESGTPSTRPGNPSIGEWALLQVDDLQLGQIAQHPNVAPWRTTYSRPQIRQRAAVRGDLVGALTAQPGVDIVMPLRMVSLAERLKVFQEIIMRGGFGTNPAIIIPNTDEPDVYYCQLPEEWTREDFMREASTGSIQFTELSGLSGGP